MTISNKPTLAVISTYDELCGIAGYTKAIVPHLDKHFNVTVFDLDQFILRQPGKRMVKMGDKEIKNICKELPKFDYVNIQLEHGTLGLTPNSIFKRFKMIVRASKNIAVTFHTIFQKQFFDYSTLFTWNIVKSIKAIDAHKRTNFFGSVFYNFMLKEQRKRKLSVIVHTRRDAKTFQTVYGFKNVQNHPLAFLDEKQAKSALDGASRDDFVVLKNIPKDSKLLGCFGFFGEYKGFEQVIDSLRNLPENYHLVIFGGLHPNAIKKGVKKDPYLNTLDQHIRSDVLVEDAISKISSSTSGVLLKIDSEIIDKIGSSKSNSDLKHRVHFAGVLSDSEFAKGMAICDVVILPYFEVGQSSSGPMSIANDLGVNIIASRTKTFMQFERYHKGRFVMFEQGNVNQLTQLIKAVENKPRNEYPSSYNIKSNIDTYKRAFGLQPDVDDRDDTDVCYDCVMDK